MGIADCLCLSVGIFGYHYLEGSDIFRDKWNDCISKQRERERENVQLFSRNLADSTAAMEKLFLFCMSTFHTLVNLLLPVDELIKITLYAIVIIRRTKY